MVQLEPSNKSATLGDQSDPRPMARRVLLNLGCGLTAPAAWCNYDGSLNAQLSRVPWLANVLRGAGVAARSSWSENVRYLNLNRPWPFGDASADVVYASHVFEHLAPASATLFLREAKRVLRPTGVLRLVVPDLRRLAQRYLDDSPNQGAAAAASFLASINLQMPHESFFRGLYGQLVGHPHVHKTMYDDATLPTLLRSFAFDPVVQSARAQSRWIPEVADVESGPVHGHDDSLYIDARPRPV